MSTISWTDDLRDGIWPRSTIVWIIAFWTALLIIRPWETIFPWMADLRVERLYAILALVALFSSGQARMISSVQTVAMVCWFLALAISSLFAFQPSESWDSLYVYITIFLFYFVLTSAVRTPYQLLFLVACYVIATGVFLAKSQIEFHFFGGHGFTMGVMRLQGDNLTYNHPNAVAALAVVALPFWTFLWKIRQEFTGGWPERWKKWYTRGMALVLVINISSIILTNSRMGLLALFAYILMVSASSGNLARILPSLAGGLVVVAIIFLLMPASNRHRMITLVSADESDINDHSAVVSAEGRKIGFQIGIEMFRRFPWTGVGLANYVYYRKANLDGGHLVAHNTYGSIPGETGIIGAAAFTFLILSVFLTSFRTRRLAAYEPEPTVVLLGKLAAACRQGVILLLFVGISGDYQRFAPLYWIAAYSVLAAAIAEQQLWSSAAMYDVDPSADHQTACDPAALAV